jgi:hypothetical protein
MSRFSVGEIALALSNDYVWHECTVIAVPHAHGNECACGTFRTTHYLIEVPSERGPCKCGQWSAEEQHMRKRPQPGIPESVLEVFRVPVRKGETA